MDAPEMSSFASTMWLAIPVVIFSFSHAAAISSFANVQRRHYEEGADVKSELILRRTSIMLIAFVLLLSSHACLLFPRSNWQKQKHKTYRYCLT